MNLTMLYRLYGCKMLDTPTEFEEIELETADKMNEYLSKHFTALDIEFNSIMRQFEEVTIKLQMALAYIYQLTNSHRLPYLEKGHYTQVNKTLVEFALKEILQVQVDMVNYASYLHHEKHDYMNPYPRQQDAAFIDPDLLGELPLVEDCNDLELCRKKSLYLCPIFFKIITNNIRKPYAPHRTPSMEYVAGVDNAADVHVYRSRMGNNIADAANLSQNLMYTLASYYNSLYDMHTLTEHYAAKLNDKIDPLWVKVTDNFRNVAQRYPRRLKKAMTLMLVYMNRFHVASCLLKNSTIILVPAEVRELEKLCNKTDERD